ncbi:unnamed protein product [marine sediment metagenome]|uniref:CBS domain-containing protein n=1 Tax=marine sediment metagenome TaxID=412755 RepID=X0ZV76_9ZZZZ
MAQNNISCVLIAEGEEVVGIITEKDFLRRALPLHESFDKITAKQIMSSPVYSISPSLSILDAGRIVVDKRIKQLPVMRDGKLLGIVTQTDLIKALTSYGMWWDVGEIMSSDVASIQNTATVSEAADVMARHNISCVVVLDNAEVVGVFTERDLVKRVVAAQIDPAAVPISEVMSSPVTSVRRDSSLFSASAFMDKLSIRRLPVMEGDKLYGIVTQTDIFRAVERKLQAEEKSFLRVLIVENVKENAHKLQECLGQCTRHAVATEYENDLTDVLDKLGRRRFDMIFLAETLGDATTARHILDALADRNIHTPVIITCTRDTEKARAELDCPEVYDYVAKNNLTSCAIPTMRSVWPYSLRTPKAEA